MTVTYSLKSEILSFYYEDDKRALYYAKDLGQFYTPLELMICTTSLDRRKTGNIESGWETFYGYIDDVHLYNHVLSETFIRSYYENTSGISNPILPTLSPNENLKVTTFNIWKGGNQFGKEVGKRRLIEELKKINSDIFLIIETDGSGTTLADAIGYQLYLISSNLSILSSYPIVETCYLQTLS